MRGKLPDRRSPPLPEEPAQHVRRFILADAGVDFGSVEALLLLEHPRAVFHRAALGVAGGIMQPRNAGMRNRPSAHRTWLQRHPQLAIGQAFVALTPRGVCNFSFLDDLAPEAPLTALAHSWPEAELREAPSRTQNVINTMFDDSKTPDRPISLHVSGTNFQISVWRALLQIPPAKVVSYAQVASAVGNPKAARAVGLAVGANPVALMIPCHRVIQQNGKLGGYHWGETRKQAIHAWEAARYE